MKLLMISLGCDKNLVDSEVMMGALYEKGFTFTDDEEEAEVIIVNTCCFIGDAKEESVETILQVAENKVEKGGKCQALIVSGCLAERYFDEIRTEIPEVDAVIGTSSIDEILTVVDKVLNSTEKPVVKKSLDNLPVLESKRLVTTGGYYAYLKIAEGCNKNCTYCIIPKLRGRYRSFTIEKLYEEAKMLAESGVKELILVAQETTLYGIDIYGKKSLSNLIEKISEIDGIQWIRILYAYPEEIDEELINVIATNKKVCHYIDMPIQSGSDEVLRRMGRKTNSEELRNKIALLRDKIPDICIRTTLISGFPGETENNHEETLGFVDEMEFDRLGVFTYSREEDTPAASFDDQIDEDIKISRRAEIMELQQEIVFSKTENMIGRKLTVFVEGKLADDDVYAARTYMDAPSVDGLIFINTDRSLMSGDFVQVRVTASNEYDLIGELI